MTLERRAKLRALDANLVEAECVSRSVVVPREDDDHGQ
jgi:hypothetical protein